MPLQKNNFLSNNLAYACFTILFILIGLTTLASSMNLLVLRLATINAEEQVQERLEAAEARRNAVHLEGDVIQPNARFFNTTEKPEQVETISVCSCACLDYKIWHHHSCGVGSCTHQHQHAQHNNKMYAPSRHNKTARTVANRRDLRDGESSVAMSESYATGEYSAGAGAGAGATSGAGVRRRWKHTLFTPTLKRLLPSRLHRRLEASRHSHYDFASCANSHANNENEFFEMIIPQANDDVSTAAQSIQANHEPFAAATITDPASTDAQNNLLNLDAINLCSSNIKRNSI